MLDSIKHRKAFVFTLSDFMKAKCYENICCRKSYSQKKNYLKYMKGVSKLNKSFEVTTILKQLRKTQLMTQVVLAKYQRTLIPYFRQYMITDVKETWEGKGKDKSKSDKQVFKDWG